MTCLIKFKRQQQIKLTDQLQMNINGQIQVYRCESTSHYLQFCI